MILLDPRKSRVHIPFRAIPRKSSLASEGTSMRAMEDRDGYEMS
jgi:hypothetical protein